MYKLRDALSFGGFLTQSELDEIMLHTEERHLQAGEHFISIGRPSNEIGFINEGIVRGYIVSATGEEATKYFLRERQFMMDVESYYNNTPSENAMQAMVACQLFVITRQAWIKLTETIPKLYILTKSLSEAALLNKIKDNDFLNFGTASEKYREFIRHYPDVALQVPQQYIASYLKITPQSLSRIRKNFGKL
jgi:CRP-like cAMP-binding protein